jgi:anti-sigma regulatory factor (Ser/Thr protein kinase)
VPRLATLSIPANPDRLKIVREMVSQCAGFVGCDEKATNDLVVAINEACMNVIQHSYGGDESCEVVIEFVADQNALICRIEDYAELADLEKVQPRKLEDVRPGGLGTHFIAELTDGFEFGHKADGSGNYQEIKKKIA